MDVCFHVLQTDIPDDRLMKTAILCQGFLAENKSVFIATDIATQAERLNQYLWSYEPTSFLPHALVNEFPDAPITIGTFGQTDKKAVLINLSEHVPEDARQFKQVCEIVTQDEPTLTLTRRHYKFYQSLGLSPSTIK